MAQQREDYFSAMAKCEVTFLQAPVAGAPVAPPEERKAIPGTPIEVLFQNSSRGCASVEYFDPDRNRQILKLESLLTFFHSDDRRPVWLRALMSLTGGATPDRLPRPISPLAARLLRDYGPGSITVIQDPLRPVLGEVVAGGMGRGGHFFPAYSYFDQYLVVKVVGRTFVNKESLKVSAQVNAWPPQGEVYHSDTVTPFYDSANLDGPPVFTFGKCTIQIKDPLPADELNAIRDFVKSLRT